MTMMIRIRLLGSSDVLDNAVQALFARSEALGFKYLNPVSGFGIFETCVGDLLLEFPSPPDTPWSVELLMRPESAAPDTMERDLGELIQWVRDFGLSAHTESGEDCQLGDVWEQVLRLSRSNTQG